MGDKTHPAVAFLRIPFLRSIFLLAVVLFGLLPLYEGFVGYPRYARLLVGFTEEDSLRVANHLTKAMGIADRLDRHPLSPGLSTEILKVADDFRLEKVKLFSADGEVVFSTEPRDVGSRNEAPYFRDWVAKGQTVTHVVHRERPTLEGRLATVDVVETYLPVMRDGRFLGAFEIYYDISARRQALDDVLTRSTVAMVGVAAVLVLILVGTLARAGAAVQARERADISLRTSEERFRNMAASADDGIIELDGSGRIAFWNPAAARIFGYPAGEAIGSTVPAILLPPRYRRVFERWLSRFLASGSSGRMVEFVGVCRDGREVPVEAAVSPLAGETGRHAIAVLRDVSARKRAEQDLRRSEATLRAVMTTALDCIILMDRDGRVVEFNPAAESTFQYRREDAIGRDLADLIVPESLRSAHRDGLHRFLTSGEGTALNHRVEMPAIRADGSEFLLELAITVIGAGHEPLFAGYLRDISERRTMEETLRRSNQELENFAYVASHDLQEPLRTVGAYVQLLQRNYGPHLDEEANEYIRFAVGGAHRMQRLIKDLLVYSRITTHGRAFVPTETGQVVDDALANLSVAIAQSGAVVTRTALPLVVIDEGQFVSLFQNLIGNAIKYRKPDVAPAIQVGADYGRGVWTFRVRDNGIGIDPRFFARIFVMFQRLHGRDEYDGTGIGLALCQRIVERHGGRLWVESEPGVGSTFFFEVPDRAVTAAPAPSATEATMALERFPTKSDTATSPRGA